MSFLKKLGEAAKSTATTIGTKSAELVETGKLTVEKKKLEGKARDLLTDAGELYYQAHLTGTSPDQEKVLAIFADIQGIEQSIAEIEEKMHAEKQPEQNE